LRQRKPGKPLKSLSVETNSQLHKWLENHLRSRFSRREAPQSSLDRTQRETVASQPLHIRSFSQRRVLTPVISTGELAEELFLR
jgi:hypothetical protein